MWNFFRFFFFLIDAEKAHYLAMDLLSLGLKIPIVNFFLRKSFQFEHEKLHSEICGMKANNPIGLAAGFDKDGRWLDALSVLGFGHIEVGTVTPLPQSGNPKPRLFRLKKDRSIINRMGFNNEGAEALAKRLSKFTKPEGDCLFQRTASGSDAASSGRMSSRTASWPSGLATLNRRSYSRNSAGTAVSVSTQ